MHNQFLLHYLRGHTWCIVGIMKGKLGESMVRISMETFSKGISLSCRQIEYMVKNEQGAMFISKEQNGPSVLGSVWLGGNGPIGHIV